jgi:N-acetylglucosaminyl-diphospho-decaprenol L-rhamnosyltransferase
VGERVAAVVVDYEAGPLLGECVQSLRADGVQRVVVVENGNPAPARAALEGLDASLVVTGRNVGYGAGANRGLAVSGTSEHVLVCNPDLRVHRGAVDQLVAALDAHPTWAIAGPRIVDAQGGVYPSVRRFPSMADAAGHALLALFWPGNPFSGRYRPLDAGGDEARAVDWVSGACFCARRAALEELGGFDEAYFMFAEDMDLCWRAHQAGWDVGVEPGAVVTHVEGVSRRRHPYRMLVAHHRSALRFAERRSKGPARAALPLAAAVLGLRLVAALADEALRRRRQPRPRRLRSRRAACGSVVASRGQSQAKRPT